jgi:hypothetical protein
VNLPEIAASFEISVTEIMKNFLRHTRWFTKKKIRRVRSPSQLPRTNPLEQLWNVLKRQYRNLRATNAGAIFSRPVEK